MNNIGYFLKEINLSIRNKEYARLDSAWEALEYHRNSVFTKLLSIPPSNEAATLKYQKEYDTCWELNDKCFNFFLTEIVSGNCTGA